MASIKCLSKISSLMDFPAEVLNNIVVESGVLELEDLYSIILTNKWFYDSFRSSIFQSLALGKPTLNPKSTDVGSSNECYSFFPSPFCLTGRRLRKFMRAVHKNYVGSKELGWVRHLAVSPETCSTTSIYIENAEFFETSNLSAVPISTSLGPNFLSIMRKICMDMRNIESLHMRLLGWPRNPIDNLLSASPLSSDISEISACVGLLYMFPHTKLDFHFETSSEVYLIEALRQNYLRIVSLYFETTKNDDQHSIEQVILRCKDLKILKVKNCNPWSEKLSSETSELEMSHIPQSLLNNDFPNLKILNLINSPNFSTLPGSILELHVDIGEFDNISHECWPKITSLPHLNVFHIVNNQVVLPRYPHNPMQQPPVATIAFNDLKTLHTMVPRPESKIFFVPPRVITGISSVNPKLENIFMPCVGGADLEFLSGTPCMGTLRSLEVQSEVMRSIVGDESFDVSDLVKLFEKGMPNLEVLKWACGSQNKMAMSSKLAIAIGRQSKPRRHNLQVLAIETRVSKPVFKRMEIDPYHEFEESAFSTILKVREILVDRCITTPDSTISQAISCCYGPDDKRFHWTASEVSCESIEPPKPPSAIFKELRSCIKPIVVTLPDDLDRKATPKQLMDLGMHIEHHNLSSWESKYLKRWRSMGGNFSAVTAEGKENNGKILKFTTGVWEDLFFFDLEKIRSFAMTWEMKLEN